jgi:hypothetical protein
MNITNISLDFAVRMGPWLLLNFALAIIGSKVSIQASPASVYYILVCVHIGYLVMCIDIFLLQNNHFVFIIPFLLNKGLVGGGNWINTRPQWYNAVKWSKCTDASRYNMYCYRTLYRMIALTTILLIVENPGAISNTDSYLAVFGIGVHVSALLTMFGHRKNAMTVSVFSICMYILSLVVSIINLNWDADNVKSNIVYIIIASGAWFGRLFKFKDVTLGTDTETMLHTTLVYLNRHSMGHRSVDLERAASPLNRNIRRSFYLKTQSTQVRISNIRKPPMRRTQSTGCVPATNLV